MYAVIATWVFLDTRSAHLDQTPLASGLCDLRETKGGGAGQRPRLGCANDPTPDQKQILGAQPQRPGKNYPAPRGIREFNFLILRSKI
jgi:hypothetical protein